MIKSVLILSFLFLSMNVKAEEPFILVELFTSEGCSSCPPADQLLIAITEEAEKQNLPIYTLSFHVDYWNRLGWEDVYSQPAYTERQYLYAKHLKSSSVYTPQMIINGQFGFTGSDHTKAWNVINNELKQTKNIEFESNLAYLNNNKYKINFTFAPHILIDTDINVAVVESEIQSHVTKGENSGRTLKHTNVVRYLNSLPLNQQHVQTTFDISPEWKKENLAVITYLQDSRSLRIFGVQKLNFLNN